MIWCELHLLVLCLMLCPEQLLASQNMVNCYSIYSDSLGWTSAQANCQSMGMHLAKIYKNTQRDILAPMLDQYIAAHSGSPNAFWHGGKASVGSDTSTWRTIDGRPFVDWSKVTSSTPNGLWYPSDPNEEGEACGRIQQYLLEGARRWVLCDIGCGSTYGYICQKLCSSPVPPPHGSAASMGNMCGDYASLSCLTGYVSTGGTSLIQCLDTEEWSASSFTCEIVKCSVVAANNSEASVSSLNYTQTVTYNCQNGYERTSGDLSRSCQANGELSGTLPVCNMVRCSVVTVNNAEPALMSVNFGQEVNYNCQSGYSKLTGDFNRTCQADGELDGTPPVCVGVSMAGISTSDCPQTNLPNENDVTFFGIITDDNGRTCAQLFDEQYISINFTDQALVLPRQFDLTMNFSGAVCLEDPVMTVMVPTCSVNCATFTQCSKLVEGCTFQCKCHGGCKTVLIQTTLLPRDTMLPDLCEITVNNFE